MRYLRIARSMFKAKPILVIFDITRLCNQRCRFCNIWRTQSDDMTVEAIAEQAERLRRSGIGYVFIQGGEPLLRRDLGEVIDVFNAKSIKPTVITNGILFDEKRARELSEKRSNVAISLDTLDEKTFTTIRGVKKFQTVRDNIVAASAIRKRGGNWAVTTTVTELSTLDEIKALEEFAKSHGYMYAIRPYVHVTGAAGKKDDILAYTDPERIVKIFEYMRDRARKNNYLASLVYDEHIQYVRGVPQPQCDALRRSIVMSPSGLFSPCIEFTGESVPFDEMMEKRSAWLERCAQCNSSSPCFYNDAREIGILWRKKWRVALAAPRIALQMLRYGNFF